MTSIKSVRTDDLIPYLNNARTHSKAQIDQIAASIQEFGFTNPVLTDGKNGIIAGHGRVMAAKKLGMSEVPTIELSYLSDSQRRAYIIADNKLAENAGWDEDLLRLELGALSEAGFNLGVIGFADEELANLMDLDNIEEEGNTGDDDLPENAETKTVSRPGDIWELGDHRVMCGDATNPAHVAALLAGDRIDCTWTDPPYNVNYEGRAGKIKNDALSPEAFHALLLDAFTHACTQMKKGCPIYVAHADGEPAFRAAFAEAGFRLSQCLIWVKNQFVLGRSDYQWRHEPILYGWKPGAAHRWYGGRAKTTILEGHDMLLVVTPDGTVQIDLGHMPLRVSDTDLQVEELPGTVLRHDKPKSNAEHPTMKPVSLIMECLRNSTRRSDLVYDPFGGSGSTLIAAQKIGRQARLMELDPRFVDVIVRRWQDFTGGDAIREGDRARFGEMMGVEA